MNINPARILATIQTVLQSVLNGVFNQAIDGRPATRITISHTSQDQALQEGTTAGKVSIADFEVP